MYTRINVAHAGMDLFVRRVIPLCLYSVTLVCNCYAWPILLLSPIEKKSLLKLIVIVAYTACSSSFRYYLVFLIMIPILAILLFIAVATKADLYSNGQYFGPGIIIIDAPAPNSTYQVNTTMPIAIDVSLDGKTLEKSL